ncbi:hypothetical protein [Nocardia asiatica]|uniref:hypothetical protein n=1 Tax=Nocardia asiatica TaxID=209252 RepID=UPI003EE2FAF8
MTRSELVNKRTREAVRDQMSGTVLRQRQHHQRMDLRPFRIDGIRLTSPRQHEPWVDRGGEVDWTDPGHVVFTPSIGPLL